MVIENKFALGQVVFLRTDPEQHKRIVTELVIMSGNLIAYGLSQGLDYSRHYETEISKDKVLQL